MAARSFFLTLARNGARVKKVVGRSMYSSVGATRQEEAISATEELTLDEFAEEEKDDLKSRIFRLRLPKRSVTNVLQKWVAEGRQIPVSELRIISRDLRRSQRYKHALEISEWMISHEEYEISGTDYAARIDLITKVFGIDAAERYFEALPSSEKSSETYTALLHSYAGQKLIDRAEELYERIKGADLSLSAITYNELMTLYMSVGQLEKVPSVVQDLKSQNVAADLFTYNLWISSCAASLDMDEVSRILDEMSVDPGFNECWNRYKKLARVYISSGHLVNYELGSLVETEKGAITQRELISYDFLVILYGGLGNKEKLDQIWKALRMTGQKVTGRNYVCVMSSYLMMGHSKEVGEVIDQWKQSASSEFHISMCHKLLEAFEDCGSADHAASFRNILREHGCKEYI